MACASDTAAFSRANELYEAGDYAEAATIYEEIIAREGISTAVLFNLGNTYQRLGKYGPAILAYERARLLSPRDPDLLANLALARNASTTFNEVDHHPRLDAALNFLSRNEWSWLVAGAALYLGGVAVWAGAFRPSRGVRQWMIASSGVAGLCVILGASALYLRRAEAARGVVLTDGAAVRLSPFENAESLGNPGPGRMVRLGVRNGEFQYVEVPGTNLKGWLAVRDVEAIFPEKPRD